jgi:hypothetical protein
VVEVRSPARTTDFSSSLCVQTSSGDHPASCPMDTGGPFPGGKARPRRDTDHSPPSSAEVVNEKELYFLFFQAPPWRVAGLLYNNVIAENSPCCSGWLGVPQVSLHMVLNVTILTMLTNKSEDSLQRRST